MPSDARAVEESPSLLLAFGGKKLDTLNVRGSGRYQLGGQFDCARPITVVSSRAGSI